MQNEEEETCLPLFVLRSAFIVLRFPDFVLRSAFIALRFLREFAIILMRLQQLQELPRPLP